MRRVFITIMIAVICLSVSVVQTSAVSSPDEAVISQVDDKYTPLYTTSPNSTDRDIDDFENSSKDYALFYTQTTLLALVAGYLVLFKIKGIDHSEKMHRRK